MQKGGYEEDWERIYLCSNTNSLYMYLNYQVLKGCDHLLTIQTLDGPAHILERVYSSVHRVHPEFVVKRTGMQVSEAVKVTGVQVGCKGD